MGYDTLVLSGNSTNAIFTLGALQRLFEENVLIKNELNTYVGTSSGSFISLLLSLNLEPIDILACICVNKSYSKISSYNFTNLGYDGILKFEYIENEVENWIVSKIGYVPTLLEIKERFGKKLYFVTFNMTDAKKEYVSWETYPNISVIKAARMSSSFPFIFSPFEWENKFYVDGGIVDNFAMKKAQSLGGKCLGLCNVNIVKPYTPSMNTFELILLLFSVLISSFDEDIIVNSGNEIIKLTYEINFFNFFSENSDLIKFFDIGYDKCKLRYRDDEEKTCNTNKNDESI